MEALFRHVVRVLSIRVEGVGLEALIRIVGSSVFGARVRVRGS